MTDGPGNGIAASRRDLARVALAWAVPTVALAIAHAATIGNDHRPLTDRVNWDAGTQLEIARAGYVRDRVYQLPGVPVLVRLLHTIVPGWEAAAVVVALAAGLAATLLFWVWHRSTGARPTERWTALALVLLYPFGFYRFGIPYNDVLFVALALAAFVLLQRGHATTAIVVATAATATRVAGVVLAVALVVALLERDGAVDAGRWWRPRFHRHLARPAHFLPLVAIAGLVPFMVYNGVRFGDPFLYFREQAKITVNSSLTQPGGWPPLRLLRRLPADISEDPQAAGLSALQGVALFLAVSTIPAVVRRFGLGVATYAVGALALIWFWGPYNFGSAGRYVIAVFPAFAILGERLARAPVPARAATFAVLAVALVATFLAFVNGWWPGFTW